MSYNINNTNPFVSIKLTQTGRQQLALGQLTFSYWTIGDSEIDYTREAIVDANKTDATLSASTRILRPFDQQPNTKSFITSNGSTNPYNVLDSGNKNIIKAVVNNEAQERGFFAQASGVYTTYTATTYTPFTIAVQNTYLSGTTTLTLTGGSGTGSLNVGDFLLLKLGNTNNSGVTVTESTRAIPNLWYKIQSLTSNSITLDRKLPNYSAQTVDSQAIFYKGGEVYDTIGADNTTAYWDSGTLSFEANNSVTCNDVPVWNMNNVWSENLAGITGLTTSKLYEDFTKFGSYPYLGLKTNYLGYTSESTSTGSTVNCNTPGTSYFDDVSKSISIIHFTNNNISNLYGEFLYIDATNNKNVEIFLPTLMYHRRNYSSGSGTSMGMRFIGSGTTKVITNTNIEYIDLIEDSSLIASGLTPRVIGKVLPQAKMIIIHDDEIVSAISYKSNRNWTLPELSATLASPSGGTSTGVLDVNETMYLTYVLENENSVSGLTTSLPCQSYVKISNTTSSAKDISFKITDVDSLPYMRKIESVDYDGLGFHAHKFKLMYQKVVDASLRPDAGSWKTYDFTSTAITSVAGETIDPKLLENQIPSNLGFTLDLLKDASATTFDLISLLNMAPNLSPENLQFGDERFFYGNLTTFIGATIYKTIFDIRIAPGQFNSTTNITRSKDINTNLPDIKVDEVGIYDDNQNLVCIGKLSTPIPLSVGNTVMIELSLDF